ncbi:MAG: LPS-assembly protein LptD [Gammaproteobacteria bacterium]
MLTPLLSRGPRGVCGIALALGCAWAVTPAAGEGLSSGTSWGLCPAEPALPEKPVIDAKQREAGSIAVNADEAEVVEEGVSTFSGNVQVSQFDQAMQANRVNYDTKQDVITAGGNVRYWDNTLFWAGEKASLERPKDLAWGEHGRYRLLNRRGRGAARLIKVETKNDITRLEDVDYTTCPGEIPAWKLAAKDIKLDHDVDRGRAWHIFLHLRNVPVLYLPYLTFPISDKRKTGLLPPTFGNSSNSGADFRIPYYWNIAPDQDATFTPRILSDRGVLLGAQYRYLTHSGDGQFDLEFLPGDNERAGDDRAAVGVTLNQPFGSGRGTATVDYNWVSDKEYVEDFGTSLSLTSERYLLQRGAASYAGGTWSVFGQVLNYQSIDASLPSASEPYKILPQVVFGYSPLGGNRRLNAYLVTDTTYFEREDSVTGARLDLAPVLSFPMRSAGTFLVPSLRVRHTQYFLEDPRQQFNDRVERTLPLFSIDSGLVLERDFRFGRAGLLHTLEPRLFYLYVPESGQEDIPVFDTGEYDISYFSLFRDNRFIGLDRIGDANQFSLGLTSRLVGRNSGWEYFRASIGQQYFLTDREVQLPGQPIEDNTVSPFIAEFAARLPSGWSAIYDLQWDPAGDAIEKSAARIRYQSEEGKIVYAAYRFRRDQFDRTEFDLEQTDVSARWPITPNWSILGRWNFSLANSETLEAVGGVEYNDCCWGVRAVFRRFLRNTEGEFDNAFFVQIELKGLAGLGRGTTTFLKRSIPGYENEF